MVLFIIQGRVKYFDKNQYLKLYDFASKSLGFFCKKTWPMGWENHKNKFLSFT